MQEDLRKRKLLSTIIGLYDLSPEANFRLATLLANNNRFDEAINIIDTLQVKIKKQPT